MNNEKLLIRQTRLGVEGESLEWGIVDISTGEQEISAGNERQRKAIDGLREQVVL